MQAKHVSYWISTVLICGLMALNAYAYLSHEPKMAAAIASLGYPAYFATLLGAAKLLGVLALLVPGWALLKEWAYAGFTIVFVSAVASHLAMGQGGAAAMPVVAFVVLAVSYATRPASRRVYAAPVAPPSV